MGIMKEKYIEDQIAEETARKRLFHNFKEVEVDEGNYEYMPKRPQSEESARVELEVDMARERERERIQMEMYDDPYLNWSGHR